MSSPEETPQIEFSVRLTENEIARASDELSFRWRWFLIPGIATSVAGIAGIFIMGPEWLGETFAVTTAGLCLICFAALMPKILIRKSIRQFRSSPALQEEAHYEIFDDRLIVTSRLARTELRWETLLKAQETASYVFLYLGPVVAYVIPVACLTPTQVSQFRELVKIRVPKTVSQVKR